MTDDFDPREPARTYAVRHDGRAGLRVIATVGDQAHAVTPWHTARSPMILPAEQIARDCGLPVGELPGREFTATGTAEALEDFQLVNDPRL